MGECQSCEHDQIMRSDVRSELDQSHVVEYNG